MNTTTTKPTSKMNDLEFCCHYIDECARFIDPFLFNDINRRGLYHFINRLSGTIPEQKAQLYARFADAGKIFGDPEIDAIAGAVDRLTLLRAELNRTEITNADAVLHLLSQMTHYAGYIQNYFKP